MAAVKIAAAQGAVTTRVEVRVRERIRIVREAGETIVKEVPVYVTLKLMLLALSIAVLSGCITPQPLVKFPAPPPSVMEPPEALRSLPSAPRLSTTTPPHSSGASSSSAARRGSATSRPSPSEEAD